MSEGNSSSGARYRLVVGAIFFIFMWTLFLIRLIWKTGPMHDMQGNQAPLSHYLAGAVAVTIMVLAWNVLMRLAKK